MKNRNFWFLKKLYEIRKTFYTQNCLSQEDIQTYLMTFDWIGSLFFILKNVIKNEKFYFAPNLCEIRRKCQERA